MLTLPGYFRPTKLWDLLVIYKGELIAAIELKSQVGPSFGNNFNNRTEESIGTAHDLWTAFREEAFGKQPRPFVGWLMMVEDAPESRRPVRDSSPHFPVFEEFKGASYLTRYDLLCQRLVQEQLYTTAAVIAAETQCGEYRRLHGAVVDDQPQDIRVCFGWAHRRRGGTTGLIGRFRSFWLGDRTMMTTTTEALSEVLRGYGRADETALASLLEVSDWERIARQELERRATSIVQALDDATLEAIAAGTLDMLAMCRQVADEIHQAA